MYKTEKRKRDSVIAVDLEGLAAMLSCGKHTARKIGSEAKARIEIGGRVLYLVQKVQEYLTQKAV